MLLLVPVEVGKVVIAGTPVEAVGLLVLAGARVGDGEANRLGLGWLIPPWAVSAIGGNADILFPPNGPDKAGLCSPVAPKDIFVGGAIPFTVVSEGDNGKLPGSPDG